MDEPKYKPGDVLTVVHTRPPGNSFWPVPPLGTRAEFVKYDNAWSGVMNLRWIDREGWDVQDGSGWSTHRFTLGGGPW